MNRPVNGVARTPTPPHTPPLLHTSPKGPPGDRALHRVPTLVWLCCGLSALLSLLSLIPAPLHKEKAEHSRQTIGQVRCLPAPRGHLRQAREKNKHTA